MLTVDDLTEGTKPALEYLEVPLSRPPRLVEQVAVCTDAWSPSPGRGDGHLRGTLVIAPGSAAWLDTPGETERRMRVLEQQGAVGLVIAARGPDVPLLVRLAGRRGSLPLLVPAFSCDTAELRAFLQHQQIEAFRQHTRRQAHLLEMAPRLSHTSEGPRRLVKWLERETGARVTVLRGPSDRTWQAMATAGNARLLTDLRNGRVTTGTLTVGKQHFLLHALGNEAPHHILTACRPTPWPYAARSLVPKVAGQLSLVACQLDLRAREQRLAHVETANRAHTLQALIAGDLEQAKHIAAPLLPDLFSTPDGEIGVLEAPPGADRRALAARCEQALGWQALTLLHPVNERHVVICRPHSDDAPGALESLAPVLRSTPRAVVGMSVPVPWARTAHGYLSALTALETARRAPERSAVHSSGESLAAVLANTSRPWAIALLRPIWETAESGAQGQRLLETARLAAAFGPVRAAELLGEMAPEGQPGPHRNTVSKRFLAAGRRAGLGSPAGGRNVLSLGDRAVLDLAIQLLDAPPAVVMLPQRRTSLHGLLASDPHVAEWATRLLAPLTPEQEQWLATWLSHDQDTQRTADSFGVHPNTMRARIDAAGDALGRSLLEPGSGPHDVLFALVVKGALPMSRIPDPVAAPPRPTAARAVA